jgi:hypothetical protein
MLSTEKDSSAELRPNLETALPGLDEYGIVGVFLIQYKLLACLGKMFTLIFTLQLPIYAVSY